MYIYIYIIIYYTYVYNIEETYITIYPPKKKNTENKNGTHFSRVLSPFLTGEVSPCAASFGSQTSATTCPSHCVRRIPRRCTGDAPTPWVSGAKDAMLGKWPLNNAWETASRVFFGWRYSIKFVQKSEVVHSRSQSLPVIWTSSVSVVDFFGAPSTTVR